MQLSGLAHCRVAGSSECTTFQETDLLHIMKRSMGLRESYSSYELGEESFLSSEEVESLRLLFYTISILSCEHTMKPCKM